MRGRFQDQGDLFSYIRPEERFPADHPLREIRKLVREVLKELSHSFGKLYSHEGRPSIRPEQLLSALLLQVFYGLRSERQLMEQLNYNLLFRWFVGLSPDDPVWDATTFTKNRDRLQRGDVFRKFMERLLDRSLKAFGWPCLRRRARRAQSAGGVCTENSIRHILANASDSD
jgi:transposase